MENEEIERIGKIVTDSFNDVTTHSFLIEDLMKTYNITQMRAGVVTNICYAYMVNDDQKIRDYLKRKLDRLLKNEDD